MRLGIGRTKDGWPR